MIYYPLNWQFQIPDYFRAFNLPVLDILKRWTGRVIQLILDKNMKALVGQISDLSNSSLMSLNVAFHDSNGVAEIYNFDVSFNESTTQASLKSSIQTAVLSRASIQSYSLTASDIVYAVPSFTPDAISAAPQAAIANAPADAVTNYNVLTTVLGTLTGAVNTANAKQNEIATKLNTLLSELRTLEIIES